MRRRRRAVVDAGDQHDLDHRAAARRRQREQRRDEAVAERLGRVPRRRHERAPHGRVGRVQRPRDRRRRRRVVGVVEQQTRERAGIGRDRRDEHAARPKPKRRASASARRAPHRARVVRGLAHAHEDEVRERRERGRARPRAPRTPALKSRRPGAVAGHATGRAERAAHRAADLRRHTQRRARARVRRAARVRSSSSGGMSTADLRAIAQSQQQLARAVARDLLARELRDARGRRGRAEQLGAACSAETVARRELRGGRVTVRPLGRGVDAFPQQSPYEPSAPLAGELDESRVRRREQRCRRGRQCCPVDGGGLSSAERSRSRSADDASTTQYSGAAARRAPRPLRASKSAGSSRGWHCGRRGQQQSSSIIAASGRTCFRLCAGELRIPRTSFCVAAVMAPQAYGTANERPGASRASSSWRAGFVFVLPSVLLIALRVREGLAPAPAAEMRERAVATRRDSAIGFTLRTAGYAEVSRHTLRSYGDRWDHIVEPHNPTVLAADVDEEDGVEFLWRVRKVASLGGAAVRVPLDEVVFESTGREVHFAFTEVNVMYAVRLEVASDSTDDGASASSPRVLEKKVRVARVSRVHARRVTRSLPLRSVSCASTSAERSDSSPRNTGTAFWTLSRRRARRAARVVSVVGSTHRAAAGYLHDLRRGRTQAIRPRLPLAQVLWRAAQLDRLLLPREPRVPHGSPRLLARARSLAARGRSDGRIAAVLGLHAGPRARHPGSSSAPRFASRGRRR